MNEEIFEDITEKEVNISTEAVDKVDELTEAELAQLANKNKTRKFVADILEIVAYALIAMIIAYLVTTYVVQRTVVDGNSMYPALKDHDNLVVNKLSYKFGEVDRFDVIVFPCNDPIKGTVCYIKRVIGLPGETVSIKDGKIYITDDNGTYELEEDYGYYENDVKMHGIYNKESITVGEDEYFVLGDNRNNSTDSRMIGTVKKKDIVGKAVLRIFPFDSFGLVD